MSHHRHAMRAGAALAIVLSAPAIAQDVVTAQAEAASEEIVVTGSRAPGRSRLDSVSPIDVLSGEALRAQGTTELAQALSGVVPSINFPRQAAVDGTDAIRPATLRGLSPDQTLVLIDGTRAHASALLNINGSVGRGAAAVDLNTIPTIALDRVEVLRDGASAQYGSDAIAGVVNLRLRQARTGGGGTVSYGRYITDVDTARTSRNENDGGAITVAGWQGIGLGSDGFLTLSAEFVDRNPTNRADSDPRKAPATIRARYGDPSTRQYTVYANAAKPIGDGGWELYGNGGYQHRRSASAAFPRIVGGTDNNPNAAAVAGIYPDGFLPLIGTRSQDYNATAGLRGELSGWKVDLTASYGRNTIDFSTRDSANATYGNALPTDFDSGRLTYDQFVGGIDIANSLPLGSGTLNVAYGAEYRREGFRIGAGQPESYNRAVGSDLRLAPGAQGFLGFQPSNEVDAHRSNVSLYLDLEAQLSDAFTIGAAVRGESYSDFGETATAKLSARYDVAPWLAFRGAASTGFRAPSLQQSYYTSTQSLVVGDQILETGLYPVSSGIAQALGGRDLEPEKSRNYSVGTVLRAGGASLTVDAYRIRIRNQIALSENIQATFSPQVANILAPFGVRAARFFINGITTTTKGIDIVGSYPVRTAALGTFNLGVAANFNDIKVNRVPTSTATLSPTPTLFGRNRVLTIEDGTPATKIVGSVDWKLQDFGVTARATYYGDVLQPGGTAATDVRTGRNTIVDLEGRYQITPAVGLAVGAANLFDRYPDIWPGNINNNGVTAFPYYSPFGFNGRQLYARVNLAW